MQSLIQNLANPYVLLGLFVVLGVHLWRTGRRIDALEEALEAEKDARRAARSTPAGRPS